MDISHLWENILPENRRGRLHSRCVLLLLAFRVSDAQERPTARFLDRGNADATGSGWQSAIFRKIKEEMKAGRGLTVERMVKLAGVSRASFYCFDENAELGPQRNMDLRDAIQRIVLEWPSYGRPHPGG